MVNLRNKAGSSVSSFWELSCINKVFVIERQEEYEYKRMSKEIKKRSFWTALILAVLFAAQATAALFGYTIDMGTLGNKLMDLVDSIFTILLILGYDWSGRSKKK